MKRSERKTGRRRKTGAQGLRRGAVCFQTISYIVHSGTVQKVLLHGCTHFLLTIFNGEAGMCMQAAWVTPVNKPRIIMNYFHAGIETSDIDVSRLIEKIKKKNNRNSHNRDNDNDKTASS